MEMIGSSVIIIGAGPVGMMLAMNLDSLGVGCIVVNEDAEARQSPKGNTHNSRTMELYRRLGISTQIRTLGLPRDHCTDVTYHTRLNGRELARIEMPSEQEKLRQVAASATTDQVLEPIFRCNQMYVENFLLKHLKALPRVETRLGWSCTDFEEHGNEVTAVIVERLTGRRESLSGRFLVGCDGGQSFVRRRLGISYDGAEPLQQAFLGGPSIGIHLRIPELVKRVIRKPSFQYWILNPRIRANLISLNGLDEFKFGTKWDSAYRDDLNQFATRALKASVGEDIDFTVIGYSDWTAGHALVAESFGTDRVLLAGDSAHLFTPTGGFGMNTGIDDAVNLAWKLAASVQGWGGKKLIQSYEDERRPIAVRNTNAARRLAVSVGDVPVGAHIDESSEDGAAERSRTTAFLANFDREFSSLGVQLGARYDHSNVIAADRDVAPPDNDLIYVPSSVPGGRAPHFWLDDRRENGSSLFDRLGRAFTLLCFGEKSSEAAPLISSACARGVPLTTVVVDNGPARDLYERDLILIRPDMYVAWRGNSAPQDCDALMMRLTGRVA